MSPPPATALADNPFQQQFGGHLYAISANDDAAPNDNDKAAPEQDPVNETDTVAPEHLQPESSATSARPAAPPRFDRHLYALGPAPQPRADSEAPKASKPEYLNHNWVHNSLVGGVKGARDVGDSLLEGTNWLLKHAGTDVLQDAVDYEDRADRQYQKDYGGSTAAGLGRIAGNMAVTALPGAGVAGAVLRGGSMAARAAGLSGRAVKMGATLMGESANGALSNALLASQQKDESLGHILGEGAAFGAAGKLLGTPAVLAPAVKEARELKPALATVNAMTEHEGMPGAVGVFKSEMGPEAEELEYLHSSLHLGNSLKNPEGFHYFKGLQIKHKDLVNKVNANPDQEYLSLGKGPHKVGSEGYDPSRTKSLKKPIVVGEVYDPITRKMLPLLLEEGGQLAFGTGGTGRGRFHMEFRHGMTYRRKGFRDAIDFTLHTFATHNFDRWQPNKNARVITHVPESKNSKTNLNILGLSRKEIEGQPYYVVITGYRRNLKPVEKQTVGLEEMPHPSSPP
ncbi:hypothetical protein [Oecophyllibacter saccharovorans]|uniref:Uncharacterized protein n=1 Tax=Oecophyllibacter saccharovorans TaxID=2558360 RepID=A0A506UM36_9PROT|nr:hypothetical protein [Oecophyllibacter saccharovorans]TPW34406.1 hypothetical protein E3202_07935 [Oecophyllibacter saccharovorans]